MAVRTGMSSIISTLRGFTNTGYADYEVNTVSYWSDQHLQDALDRYVTIVRDETITPIPAMVAGGSVNYFDYQSRARFFETTTGGTARFIIRNVGGTAITTGWLANYERGVITFTANQAGSAYYLTGYSYDVYAAAAEVWRSKAAHASEQIDFSTPVHNIKRSHIVAAALKMATQYDMLATTTFSASGTEMVRGDLNAI